MWYTELFGGISHLTTQKCKRDSRMVAACQSQKPMSSLEDYNARISFCCCKILQQNELWKKPHLLEGGFAFKRIDNSHLRRHGISEDMKVTVPPV